MSVVDQSKKENGSSISEAHLTNACSGARYASFTWFASAELVYSPAPADAER
jgi:hypothetical protein